MISYKRFSICPNLKGCVEGASCAVMDKFVRDMDEDCNIKICLSRHFESCCIYYSGLKTMAFSSPVAEEAPVHIEP